MALSTTKHSENPDGDDMLIVIRADDSVLMEPSVIQEEGLLFSHKHKLALPRVESIPLMKFGNPDLEPFEDKRLFMQAMEVPHPTTMPELLQHGLDSFYLKVLAGDSKVQRAGQSAMNKAAYIAMGISGGVFALTTLMYLWRNVF